MAGYGITLDTREALVRLCEGGHLHSRLELPGRLPGVDDQHQRTLHPDQAELNVRPLPGQVYGCEVRLRDSYRVSNDDSLARTEVVQGDHETVSSRVAHDEGEGDGVLGVDAADHNSENHLKTKNF